MINIFTMSSSMDYVRKDFLTHVSPLQQPENTLFYIVSFTQTIVAQRRQKDACVNGRVLSSPSWVTPGGICLATHSQAHGMGKTLFLGSSPLCLLKTCL